MISLAEYITRSLLHLILNEVILRNILSKISQSMHFSQLVDSMFLEKYKFYADFKCINFFTLTDSFTIHPLLFQGAKHCYSINFRDSISESKHTIILIRSSPFTIALRI